MNNENLYDKIDRAFNKLNEEEYDALRENPKKYYLHLSLDDYYDLKQDHHGDSLLIDTYRNVPIFVDKGDISPYLSVRKK